LDYFVVAEILSGFFPVRRLAIGGQSREDDAKGEEYFFHGQALRTRLSKHGFFILQLGKCPNLLI
jgi:hypothetical protein